MREGNQWLLLPARRWFGLSVQRSATLVRPSSYTPGHPQARRSDQRRDSADCMVRKLQRCCESDPRCDGSHQRKQRSPWTKSRFDPFGRATRGNAPVFEELPFAILQSRGFVIPGSDTTGGPSGAHAGPKPGCSKRQRHPMNSIASSASPTRISPEMSLGSSVSRRAASVRASQLLATACLSNSSPALPNVPKISWPG